MSSSSSSSSSSSRSPSTTKPINRSTKLFISNLDGATKYNILEDKVKELVSKYCTVLRIDVKKSYYRDYCYAFLEIKQTDKADNVIQNLHGMDFDGKKLTVERQKGKRYDSRHDRMNSRKSYSRSPKKRYRSRSQSYSQKNKLKERQAKGLCYECGKPGHLARFCSQKQSKTNDIQVSQSIKKQMRKRRQSAERSRSIKHKRRRRQSSSSSSSQNRSSRSSSQQVKKHKQKKQKREKKHAKRSRKQRRRRQKERRKRRDTSGSSSND